MTQDIPSLGWQKKKIILVLDKKAIIPTMSNGNGQPEKKNNVKPMLFMFENGRALDTVSM